MPCWKKIMNKTFILVLSLSVFCPTGFAFAANTQQPVPTPSLKTGGPRQNMLQINMRFSDQWKKISVEQKSGKISSEQVKSLIGSLKSIHIKERTFLRQDGRNDLTADQTSELNQLLDANEPSIPK
jgi:hypothetical protein